MIFFDIDDTLLDYRSSQDFAAREFAKIHAPQYPGPQGFVEHWNHVTEKHMARYLAGDISFQEQRRDRIRESLDLTLADGDADQLFDRYYRLYEASWQLFPEVEDALEGLAEYRLGIISNGDRQHQVYKLDTLGVLHYFDDIVTPDCAGAAKPDHRIYEVAASRSGLLPAKCWYVGDNYHTDYQGALRGGFKAVWLNRFRDPVECDAQCENLLDFQKRFQKHDE